MKKDIVVGGCGHTENELMFSAGVVGISLFGVIVTLVIAIIAG